MKNKTVILMDLVGGYDLPMLFNKVTDYVTIRLVYDGHNVKEVLRIALKKLYPGMTKEEYDGLIETGMEVNIQAIIDGNYEVSSVVEEMIKEEEISGELLQFTIWREDKNLPLVLKKFQEICIKELNSSSGDDSFYDYIPSLVDVYRQLCSMNGEEGKKSWKEFLETLAADNDFTYWVEEAIYTTEL